MDGEHVVVFAENVLKLQYEGIMQSSDTALITFVHDQSNIAMYNSIIRVNPVTTISQRKFFGVLRRINEHLDSQVLSKFDRQKLAFQLVKNDPDIDVNALEFKSTSAADSNLLHYNIKQKNFLYWADYLYSVSNLYSFVRSPAIVNPLHIPSAFVKDGYWIQDGHHDLSDFTTTLADVTRSLDEEEAQTKGYRVPDVNFFLTYFYLHSYKSFYTKDIPELSTVNRGIFYRTRVANYDDKIKIIKTDLNVFRKVLADFCEIEEVVSTSEFLQILGEKEDLVKQDLVNKHFETIVGTPDALDLVEISPPDKWVIVMLATKTAIFSYITGADRKLLKEAWRIYFPGSDQPVITRPNILTDVFEAYKKKFSLYESPFSVLVPDETWSRLDKEVGKLKVNQELLEEILQYFIQALLKWDNAVEALQPVNTVGKSYHFQEAFMLFYITIFWNIRSRKIEREFNYSQTKIQGLDTDPRNLRLYPLTDRPYRRLFMDHSPVATLEQQFNILRSFCRQHAYLKPIFENQTLLRSLKHRVGCMIYNIYPFDRLKEEVASWFQQDPARFSIENLTTPTDEEPSTDDNYGYPHVRASPLRSSNNTAFLQVMTSVEYMLNPENTIPSLRSEVLEGKSFNDVLKLMFRYEYQENDAGTKAFLVNLESGENFIVARREGHVIPNVEPLMGFYLFSSDSGQPYPMLSVMTFAAWNALPIRDFGPLNEFQSKLFVPGVIEYPNLQLHHEITKEVGDLTPDFDEIEYMCTKLKINVLEDAKTNIRKKLERFRNNTGNDPRLVEYLRRAALMDEESAFITLFTLPPKYPPIGYAYDFIRTLKKQYARLPPPQTVQKPLDYTFIMFGSHRISLALVGSALKKAFLFNQESKKEGSIYQYKQVFYDPENTNETHPYLYNKIDHFLISWLLSHPSINRQDSTLPVYTGDNAQLAQLLNGNFSNKRLEEEFSEEISVTDVRRQAPNVFEAIGSQSLVYQGEFYVPLEKEDDDSYPFLKTVQVFSEWQIQADMDLEGSVVLGRLLVLTQPQTYVIDRYVNLSRSILYPIDNMKWFQYSAIRVREDGRINVEGHVLDATYAGNILRYVSYTKDLRKANAKFIFNDDNWVLRTTRALDKGEVIQVWHDVFPLDANPPRYLNVPMSSSSD